MKKNTERLKTEIEKLLQGYMLARKEQGADIRTCFAEVTGGLMAALTFFLAASSYTLSFKKVDIEASIDNMLAALRRDVLVEYEHIVFDGMKGGYDRKEKE